MQETKPSKDPNLLRIASILNQEDVDADEHLCERHEEYMDNPTLSARFGGVLHTTTDEYDVYHCKKCLVEASHQTEHGPVEVFKQHVLRLFEIWDGGGADASVDWFVPMEGDNEQ